MFSNYTQQIARLNVSIKGVYLPWDWPWLNFSMSIAWCMVWIWELSQGSCMLCWSWNFCWGSCLSCLNGSYGACLTLSVFTESCSSCTTLIQGNIMSVIASIITWVLQARVQIQLSDEWLYHCHQDLLSMPNNNITIEVIIRMQIQLAWIMHLNRATYICNGKNYKERGHACNSHSDSIDGEIKCY